MRNRYHKGNKCELINNVNEELTVHNPDSAKSRESQGKHAIRDRDER